MALVTCGCGPTQTDRQREADANSAAGKAGKAAHTAAVKAGAAATVVGRKLEKAAHQAHEGWKEAARENRAKSK